MTILLEKKNLQVRAAPVTYPVLISGHQVLLRKENNLKCQGRNELALHFIYLYYLSTNQQIIPNNFFFRYERMVRKRISFTSSATSPANEVALDTQIAEVTFEIRNESMDAIEVPTRDDKMTQVDVFTVDNTSPFGTSVVIFSGKDRCDGICHAETQIYTPTDRRGDLKIVKKRNTAEKSCCTTVKCLDVGVGPDVSDVKKHLECLTGFHGFSSIRTDKLLHLCGVTIDTFNLLLEISPNDIQEKKISRENCLVIFLAKLKLGISFSALGVIFQVDRRTVARIFYMMVTRMKKICGKFIFWPCRDVLQQTMPETFKQHFPNCRVIIDCFEIKVQQPANIGSRVRLYSHYKKGFTTKILVGCSPCGGVTFISECFNGRISDCQITVKSGILDLLEPGDVVLADKGFPNIMPKVDDNGEPILIVMPPYLRDPFFSREDVEKTYGIARHRIHVERIIQRFRIYKILDKFTYELYPYIDDIMFMIGVLVNLQPPIIKESGEDSEDEEIESD